MLNATFNNVSVISWRSVLLVEETEVPGEILPNCRKSLTNFITLCCIEYTSSWTGFELTTLVENPTTIPSRPRRPHVPMNSMERRVTLSVSVLTILKTKTRCLFRTSGDISCTCTCICFYISRTIFLKAKTYENLKIFLL